MPYVQRQQIDIKVRRVILALRTTGVYPIIGIGNPRNVCVQTSVALAHYRL